MPQADLRHRMAAEPRARLAFDACEQESPAILQAQFAESGSRAEVQEAEAGHRPFEARDFVRNVPVSTTLNQPIFAGGLIGSQVRQAEAEAASARVQVNTLTAQETFRDVEIALAVDRHGESVLTSSLLTAGGRLGAWQLLQRRTLNGPNITLQEIKHEGSVPCQVVPSALVVPAALGKTSPSGLQGTRFWLSSGDNPEYQKAGCSVGGMCDEQD